MATASSGKAADVLDDMHTSPALALQLYSGGDGGRAVACDRFGGLPALSTPEGGRARPHDGLHWSLSLQDASLPCHAVMQRLSRRNVLVS